MGEISYKSGDSCIFYMHVSRYATVNLITSRRFASVHPLPFYLLVLLHHSQDIFLPKIDLIVDNQTIHDFFETHSLPVMVSKAQLSTLPVTYIYLAEILCISTANLTFRRGSLFEPFISCVSDTETCSVLLVLLFGATRNQFFILLLYSCCYALCSFFKQR